MSKSVSANDYRPDIDGLRALAVLLVVAYHARIPLFPGGFLGVDVFFVISGYVITRLLVSEFSESGTISICRFWQRRIARLWPALLVVLATVLMVMPLFVTRLSGEIGPMAKAALASIAVNANHFFLFESADYFAAASETNPLLHMWSLSVEEQFYLIWPVLLLAILRRVGTGSADILRSIIVIAFLSCALGVVLSIYLPAYAFYLLPPRAWQLLVGAALAVLELRRAVVHNESHGRLLALLQWLGLTLMIVAAATDVGEHREFASVRSFAAVLGCALLVWAGRFKGGAGAARWLAGPVVVYIGRISYPIYLWHWPLLAIARSHRMYEDSRVIDAACVVLAVVLASLTHRWVEIPLRTRLRAMSWRHVAFSWSGSALVLCIVATTIGAWTRFGWGYDMRERALDAARRDQSSVGCIFSDEFPTADRARQCYPNVWKQSILMWGDSHGHHWSPAFAGLALAEQADFASFNMGACRPLPRQDPGRNCGEFYQQVSSRIPEWKRNSGLVGVVLSSRWAEGTGAIPLSAGDRAQSSAGGFDDRVARNVEDALVLFEWSLRRQFDLLQTQGLRVLIILPTPSQRFHAAHCLAIRSEKDCFVTTAENDQYSGRVRELILRTAAHYSNVRVFDPNRILCQDGRCPVVVNGLIAYSDDDHLSQTWVRSVAPVLKRDVAWLLHGDHAPLVAQ